MRKDLHQSYNTEGCCQHHARCRHCQGVWRDRVASARHLAAMKEHPWALPPTLSPPHTHQEHLKLFCLHFGSRCSYGNGGCGRERTKRQVRGESAFGGRRQLDVSLGWKAHLELGVGVGSGVWSDREAGEDLTLAGDIGAHAMGTLLP